MLDSQPAGPVTALTLRMFVTPLSGSMRRGASKSTSLPFVRSLSPCLPAASRSAFRDEGMPQRAMMSSRLSAPLRTTGAR